MNSTMWKIALRTLARDETYALIDVIRLLARRIVYLVPAASVVSRVPAYLTVALQSLRAARAHPVRALRYI
jgi:hypothetical protein